MLDFPGLAPAHLGSQLPWRSPPCPEPWSADVPGAFPATLPSPLPSPCFSRAPRPGFGTRGGRGSGLRYFRTLASRPPPPTPRVRVDRATSACSAASPGRWGRRQPWPLPRRPGPQVLRGSERTQAPLRLPARRATRGRPLARRGAGVAFFNALPRGQPGLPSKMYLGPAGSQRIKRRFSCKCNSRSLPSPRTHSV